MDTVEALAIALPTLGPSGARELFRQANYLESLIEANPHQAERAPLLRISFFSRMLAESLHYNGQFLFPRQGTLREQCGLLAVTLELAEQLRIHHHESTRDITATSSSSTPHGVGEVSPEQTAVVLSPESAAAEVERLFQEAGALESCESVIASVLLRHGGSVSAVLALGNKIFIEPRPVSLRDENGVDARLEIVRWVELAANLSAYTGDESLLSRLIRDVRHPWEDRLISAIAWVGHTRGSFYAGRREKNPSKSLIDLLRAEFLPMVQFSLAERSRWEDAYHIPELFVPKIWEGAAALIADFEPLSARAFVELLAPHFSNQLGLYTEGYRQVLRGLAERLRPPRVDVDVCRTLRLALFEHLRSCVFNRIERVPEMLECADGFALLGDRDNAHVAFQCAIKSSLGPNWYKEDQFSLIRATLKAANDSELVRQKWKDVTETLEAVSGELTFQRYVRQEKGLWIRDLLSAGCMAEAMAVYTQYLLPPLEIQKQRILGTKVDRVGEFSGARFGAPEVYEQQASLQLLAGLEHISPLRRWALVELFTPVDGRYFDRFAEITCQLLSNAAGETIGRRLLQFLRADFDPERGAEFLEALKNQDVDRAHVRWFGRAEAFWPPQGDSRQTSSRPGGLNQHTTAQPGPKEDFSLPGVFITDEARHKFELCVDEVEKRLSQGDKSGARELARDGLISVQAAGSPLWSSQTRERTLLQKLWSSGPAEDVLRTLRPVILSEQYAARWEIAHALIETATPVLNKELRAELFSIASDHVHLIIGPEREQLDASYETRDLRVESSLSVEECFDDVLLRLLDHPNPQTRCRAASIVYWLTLNNSFNISRMFSRVSSKEPGHSREISAGILHSISQTRADLLSGLIEDGSIAVLLSDPNFAVRHAGRAILQTRGTVGTTATSPGTTPIPATKPSWSWKRDVEEILEACGGAAIAARAEAHFRELCAPHPPDAVVSLWDIRCEGFGISRVDPWSSAWEREALFRAVETDTPDQVGDLAEALMYNPLWPDSDLDLDWGSMALPLLERLQANDLDLFSFEDSVILHLHEKGYDRSAGKVSEFEVAAFLVSQTFFDGHMDHRKIMEFCSVHDSAPANAPVSFLATLNEPAIIRYYDRPRVGGSLTPARPSVRLAEVTRLPDHAFQRIRWQEGRIWDPWGVGPPLIQGTVTLMKGMGALSVSGMALAWVVFRDREIYRIVDPTRRRIYKGGGR